MSYVLYGWKLSAAKRQANVVGATGRGWGHLLISRLWTAAKLMEHNDMLELINRPSRILFDAAESGNIEILDLVFQSNPELLMEVDGMKRNLLHIAVLNRQVNVLAYMMEKRVVADRLMLEVDDSKNNILHFAAMLPPPARLQSSQSPDVQMQRELLWFKVNVDIR